MSSNNSYFISHLYANEIAKLKAAGVNCIDFSLTPVEPGVLVTAEHQEKMVRTLALYQAIHHYAPTSYDGVLRVRFQAAQPQPASRNQPALPELLQPVLEEIGRLQQWSGMTDGARVERFQLLGRAKGLEEDLRSSTAALESKIKQHGRVKAHVEGLKAESGLPVELVAQLDGYLSEMERVEASERQTNADRSAMLKQAKEALAAHLNQPRLTPESVLGSADDALSAAGKLVGHPVVQPGVPQS